MKKTLFLLLSLCLSPLQAATYKHCFIAKEGNTIIQQEGDCTERYIPFSSFKVALSLMGFEQGFLKNTTTPALPYEKKYDAYYESREVCERVLNPAVWMNLSCVWYSQAITLNMGMENFQKYVTLFQYGNEDVSGTPGKNNGLTNAWLRSSLRISPVEHVTFIEKLMLSQLPISQQAQAYTKNIIQLENLNTDWAMYGKTGSGYQEGWFVGWIEKGDRCIAFAQYLEGEHNENVPHGKNAKENAKKQLGKIVVGA